MKKIILPLLAVACSYCYSQVTLDKEFTISNSVGGCLFTINLDVSGFKYVVLRELHRFDNDTVMFYNPDYSIFKEIIIADSLTDPNRKYYFSEKLFDNDNEIEYIACNERSFKYNTYIIDENGEVEQTFKDCSIPYKYSTPNSTPEEFSFNQDFIYSIGDQTKMILYKNTYSFDRIYNIYNLPGQLIGIQESDNSNNSRVINAYPNPTSHKITFELPNDSKMATIEIFNSNGTNVKSFNVDNTFGKLLVDVSGMSSGLYIYKITGSNSLISEGKFIVE